MNYIIIAQLILRPFICEQSNVSLAFFYDMVFIGLFFLSILFREHLKVKNMIFLLSLIFPFFIALSNLFSVNTFNSGIELLRVFVLVLIFNFVYLLKSGQRRLLIAGMLGVSGIICLRALYQYFSGIDFIRSANTFEQLTQSGYYAWEMLLNKRVVSWFSSPNILGGYLIAFCPLASVYLFESIGEKNKRKIGLFSILCLILFLSVFLTKSLAVFLSFILSMVLLFVLIGEFKKQRGMRRYAGIVLVLFFICMGGLFFSRREAFIDLKNPQNSMTQRVYYWQSALKIISEHPLSGVGAGNFKLVYPRFKNISANETIYAHNSYLQIWAESGLPAFLFFGLFIFIVFKNALKSRLKLLDAAMISGCLAVLMLNFLDYSFFISQSAHVWWIFLACVLFGSEKEESLIECSYLRLKFLKLFYLVLSGSLFFNIFLFYKSDLNIKEAVMFFGKKQFDKSIDSALAALRYKPNNDLAYYILARNYRTIENGALSKAALDHYKKAVSLNENYAFYYGEIAVYFLTHKKIDQAGQWAELALKFYPHNPKFLALNSHLIHLTSD